MKYLVLLVSVVSLLGCVTVVTPPIVQVPPAAVVKTERTAASCLPFLSPHRARIPKEPPIEEAGGSYIQALEDLAEGLAKHVLELREYIDNEHHSQDRAIRDHHQTCQSQ